ncbi:Nudix hydrolase domain-containing protein [Kibdelosporangium persicum]
MASVDEWNGRTACVLQAALRLSNDAFAAHLGVAPRTVATWHQKPDLIPRSDMQQLLDTALDRASEAAQARFARLLGDYDGHSSTVAGEPQALRIAIAVVVKDTEVLIVCRRGDDGGGISWQFPAGMIKPGVRPDTVAVRETLAETGVHCAVVRHLGNRVHPVTNVLCEYVLCEYLSGEAENKDVVENVSVTWIDKENLIRFIPADRIFPPVLEALEVPSE